MKNPKTNSVNFTNERIMAVLDDLSIEQVEELLGDDMQQLRTKISGRTTNRIKETTAEKIGGATPRRKASIWQVMPAVAAFVLVLGGAAAGFYFLAGNEPPTPTTPLASGDTDSINDTNDTNDTNTPTISSYSWLVQPTVKIDVQDGEKGLQDQLSFCGHGFNGSINGNTGMVNETTLQIMGETCGHGGGTGTWVIDRNTNTFGRVIGWEGGSEVETCTLEEVATKYNTDEIFMVFDVDLTKKVQDEYGEHLPPEAYLGTVALMHNGVFTTDFIYSDIGRGRYKLQYGEGDSLYFVPFNVVSVVKNDKHGIVDKNGSVVVPFEFENILVISETTAFAKVNGLYGIIEFVNNAPAVFTSETGESIDEALLAALTGKTEAFFTELFADRDATLAKYNLDEFSSEVVNQVWADSVTFKCVWQFYERPNPEEYVVFAEFEYEYNSMIISDRVDVFFVSDGNGGYKINRLSFPD